MPRLWRSVSHMSTAAATITVGRRTIAEGARVDVVHRNANGTVTLRLGNTLAPVPAIWIR